MPKLRTFQDFLSAHTSPATPSYLEADQWQREGWTWERVVAEWHKGEDILWAALEMGLIPEDDARKLACACVDRCGDIAPDVVAVSDAVKRGDMTAASFGAACIMGNAEGKEPELPKDGKEPIMPVAEPTEIPGAAKARYAASLLPVDTAWTVMAHAAKAKSFEAQGAWAKAVAAGESAQKLRVLEGLADYAEKAEHLAHAEIIRDYLRGAK